MPWIALHEEVEGMFSGLAVPVYDPEGEGVRVFVSAQSPTYTPVPRDPSLGTRRIENRSYYQANSARLKQQRNERYALSKAARVTQSTTTTEK